MYGSSFWIDTLNPCAFRSRPSEAQKIPLPSEEDTPPVTKMYFAAKILRIKPPHAHYSADVWKGNDLAEHAYDFLRATTSRPVPLRFARAMSKKLSSRPAGSIGT